MKTLLKRILTVLMSLCILFCGISCIFLQANAQTQLNTVGEIVEFGAYPQSEVKDEETLTALNSFELNWVSYGYYSGNGDYGSMTQSDFMKYADISYNGERYRAVRFTAFRPWQTQTKLNDLEYICCQEENGYSVDTTYWFKFDALKWRVLDEEKGLIICETVIDSQPFNNLLYYVSVDGKDQYYSDKTHKNFANDYATSSIRKWLNEDFYNTAFDSDEKKLITKTTLDNSHPFEENGYRTSTEDNIFLLSFSEVNNRDYHLGAEEADGYYIISSTNPSDYSLCQGLNVDNIGTTYDGLAQWILRTYSDVFCPSIYTYFVDNSGHIENYLSANACSGIRPAACVDFSKGSDDTISLIVDVIFYAIEIIYKFIVLVMQSII